MSKLLELKNRANECVAAMKEIQAKSSGKTGEMPAEDQAIFDRAYADYESVMKQIENEQKVEQSEGAVSKIGEVVKDLAKTIEKGTAPRSVANAFMKMLCASGVDRSRAYGAYEADLKALSVGVPAEGGYALMPLELASTIIDLVKDRCYIRGLATVFPSLTNAESLGVLTVSDVDDYSWTTEITSATEDTNTPFGRRELRPHRAAKLIKVSKKLLRQAPNAETYMLDRIAYVRARTEEKGFLTGTGVGQPLGFLVEDAQGVSTSRTTSTATANVLAIDDIFGALAAVKGDYRTGFAWFMHRNLEARLRKLKDSNNNYVWQPGYYNGNLAVGPAPATLCGFPYFLTEFMTDPGVTGNITTGTMVLGGANLQRGYGIVDSLNMEIVAQNELYAASNQIGYVFQFETDGAPLDENAFTRIKAS